MLRGASRWGWATLLVLSLLGQLEPAAAQSTREAAEDIDRAGARDDASATARRLFEEGRDAYEAGDYELAVERFERALKLVRDVQVRVLMLVNIGQAYDRLRMDEEALDAYEQYARLMPDGPRIDFVRKRIRTLRRALGRDPLAPGPGEPHDGGGASWLPWVLGGAALVVAAGVVVGVLVASGEASLPENVGPVQWDTTALREERP